MSFGEQRTHTNEPVIRRYEPRDREAVRRICCDTADRGEPCESFFPDRDVLADLLTRYYTDCEPESSRIAELNGEIVGYLNGCLNTSRCNRIRRLCIAPRAILKGVFRGIVFHPQTVALLKSGFQHLFRPAPAESIDYARYPAHLHVNIRRGLRAHHLGTRLVSEFCDWARAKGCPGVHASVREDNPTARGFFERLGFEPVSRVPGILHGQGSSKVIDSIVYGKSL
jgi:hypothetical protein